MKVIILGEGVGGKLAAQGIASKYPYVDVTLIGPETKAPSGLFYFNEEVPGIAEKPVKVTYSSIGELTDNSFVDYQIKSRGYYDPSVKISSFDKIGKAETGYLLNTDFNLSGVNWIKDECERVDLISKKVFVKNIGGNLRAIFGMSYDLLISTIPLNTFVGSLGGSSEKIESMMEYQPVYVKEMKVPSNKEIEEIVVHYDLTSSPYYRHSSYYSAGREIVEMRAETIKTITDYTKKLYPGKIVKSSVKGSQIYCLADNIEKANPCIRILGRYARWDYHYLVTDTYRDALEFVKNYLVDGTKQGLSDDYKV